MAVILPEGEDLNEWLAVNSQSTSLPTKFLGSSEFVAIAFFNQINILYGTITEFCTELECPIMNAGPRFEFHWQDGKTFKKPTKLSAPSQSCFSLSNLYTSDNLRVGF